MSKNEDRGWLERNLYDFGQVGCVAVTTEGLGLICDTPRSAINVGVMVALTACCFVGSIVLSVMRGRPGR